MKKFLLVAGVLLLTLVIAVTTTPAPHILFAQGTDPVSVYNALVTAQNAHNTDAAAALFADNATVVVGAQSFTGKSEIAVWLSNQVAQNFQDVPGTPQVTNNMLLVQDKLTTNTLTQLGVSSVPDNIQVVVNGGKITTYVSRLAVTAEQSLITAIGKVTPPTDPVAVVIAYQAAQTAGDAAKSATFYADDAVISGLPSASANGIYTGKDAISTYLQMQVAQHIKIDGAIHMMVGPNTVLSTAHVTSDAWTKLGIAPLDVYTYFVVSNGKIEQQIINLTPASILKLVAATKTN